MIVDLFRAFDVLGGHDSGLSRALVGDDPAQVNDAVAHDHVQAERAPILLFQGGKDAVADMVVVGGRIGNLAGKTCDSLQQVGAGHDADQRISAYDRQTLDVVPFHEI